jgi:hypothetical protein
VTFWVAEAQIDEKEWFAASWASQIASKITLALSVLLGFGVNFAFAPLTLAGGVPKKLCHGVHSSWVWYLLILGLQSG